jgi:hypothetical protein
MHLSFISNITQQYEEERRKIFDGVYNIFTSHKTAVDELSMLKNKDYKVSL